MTTEVIAPFDERAEAVLACVYHGIHHCFNIKKYPKMWVVNHRCELSTFDFDELTRLVVSAHDQCVRATVSSSGPGMVKITLRERSGREGRMYERHPTMEDAIATIRK